LASRGSPLGFGRKGRHGLFALLGVLAILVQCLVAQTHIHNDDRFVLASAPIVAFDVEHVAFGAPFEHQHPAHTPPHSDRNPSSCFLCQTALAGAGVLPTAPVFAIVDLREVEAARPGYEAPITGAPVSHHWQGRAPPTLSALI
jgi:hypothetical protein